MRPSPTSNTVPSLVPRWLSWAIVAGSLGLAAALIPNQRQLVGRLLEDGENQRAFEVARSSEPAPAALPAAGGTATPELKLSPMEQLQAALTPDYHGPGAVATLAIENAADPAACLELVHRMESNLSPDKKRPLYLAITRSALAANNPAMAAQIAEDAVRNGVADRELRLSAVTSWRWASNPEKALAVFDRWRAGNPADLDAAAVDIEIALCRETGKNSQALDRLLERVKSGGGPATADEALLELTLTVAANAARTGDVLPVISAWLAAQPAGSASVQEIAAGKVKTDPGFLRLAGLLARHSEWGGQPSTALDWYLKLGVQGDVFALERAEELQKGLSRSSDWMEVLRHVVPVQGHPQYTRQLARLMGEAGLYNEAPAIYELWLKDHPRDTAAIAELGGLYSEMPEPEKAMALYQKVVEINPDDLEARKEIADLRLVLKDYPGAFAFYNSIPEAAHDATTLENLSLLAESLGDYAAYNRSLLMRYHRLHEPTSIDFLELARSFELINQPDKSITTLTEGLRRVSSSRVLRTHLAQAWRNRGNYDEAIRLLAVPALKNDLQAMSLFIEVCCLKEDYQQAFAFLGRGIEKKFGFPPDVRLDLGHIYFNNGYMTEADALYSSVPDEPSLWPLIANARFRRGDLAGAETYQRRHLAAIQVPDAQGWLLMGDILRAGGREAEAQEAYQKSLRMMEQKLTPRPVAEAPESEAPPRPPTTAFNPSPVP